MSDRDLNPQIAGLLQHHGVRVKLDGEFVNSDLPGNIKFKARATYQQINDAISSRLDVTVVTGKDEEIIECFGDYGETLKEALSKNLQNFAASSLHPILAALGCPDPHVYHQVTVEEWELDGKIWEVYMGNLIPKILTKRQDEITPPAEFFSSFEQGIKSQTLNNRLHWFRGYYCQVDDRITVREFVMDNGPMSTANGIFRSLPAIPDVKFYSCRNFIVLKMLTK
ncbi:MAG: DUF6348 family protein [Janthinobacterium lividum]